MRPVSFNQDVKALIPRPGLLPEYLTYAIHGQRTRILELVSSAGSGTGVLDTSLLKRLPIWLPAVDEQQAIIEVISDAEAATDVIENLIIKSQDRKMGMMQQLLTGRTRLPGYTEAWNSGPLKDFIPLQRGFDLPTSQVKTGPYPVVYSNGVARYHAQAMVQGPGVVTGRSGTIGNIHYVEQDYWPHNTALWVTSFARVDARFAYYFLTHLGLEQFASGSGVPTLNRNDAHSFEISLPGDREEQNAIARVLTDTDNEIAVLHGR